MFPNSDPVMFTVAFYGCLLAELVPVPIEVPLTRKVAAAARLGVQGCQGPPCTRHVPSPWAPSGGGGQVGRGFRQQLTAALSAGEDTGPCCWAGEPLEFPNGNRHAVLQ